jgi:hypothetical protein
VLWRKVQRGLSAGRVQSPALRMIVEREEEIEAFKAREYWSVEAQLAHASQPFVARLLTLDGKKFEQFDLTNGDDAEAARERLLAGRGRRAGRLRRAEQGAQAPSGTAVHHFDPAAGSRTQARLFHQPHHAHRAEAVRGRGPG